MLLQHSLPLFHNWSLTLPLTVVFCEKAAADNKMAHSKTGSFSMRGFFMAITKLLLKVKRIILKP